MITGHSNPAIIDAIKQQLEYGLSFGAPTEIEIQLAEKVKALMPNIDLIRMTSSGTEKNKKLCRCKIACCQSVRGRWLFSLLFMTKLTKSYINHIVYSI